MTTAAEKLKLVLAEIERRSKDALRLFRPLSTQVPIICSKASELVVRGGNRSGKSTIAAILVASAARRTPLTGPDGKTLPHNFPVNRPMTIWVIGKGEAHIGQTLHRLLFEPGVFKVIKDKQTGRLRAFRPHDPADVAREDECEQSPALIPPDEIENISYKNKGSKHFDTCTLKNGTTITAYTSGGDVKMGDPVDLIWVDEDIEYPAYVNEWLARLSDRKGRFLWSAWPHSHNYALTRMSSRAKEQAGLPNPDVQEFVLRFSDNPFIDEKEKAKRREAWSSSSEAEVRSRDDGEFITDTILMYPEFNYAIHGVVRKGAMPDAISVCLERCRFQPPRDWTRYLFLDPGHSTTAVLFEATPPPMDSCTVDGIEMPFGDARVIYDELYLHGCTADQLAKAVKEKISGHVFQEFVIDGRLARQTISGVGESYLSIYAKAFERYGLRSVVTGSTFRFSNDNVAAGIAATRELMRIRSDGTTALRVVEHNTRNFYREIQDYKKNMRKEEAEELPASGQKDHLMDCLRYIAMHGCPWVPQSTDAPIADPVYESFKRFKGLDRPAAPISVYCGAGGVPRAV